MKKYETKKLADIVSCLCSLKQEGGYWDFKREWYKNDANGDKSLLHDIICMANNLESCDAYIIIGIDEENDYAVQDICNDTNRKTTQNLVDFLRDKKFAGGVRPTVSVESISYINGNIDVITVHFDRNSPYFLTETYKGVFEKNIYTRVKDTNTPINKNADLNHIEMLWKRRFGLDASIHERFLILLDDYEQWECHWGNRRPAFHKSFPEFRIEEKHEEGFSGQGIWITQSAFHPNPNTYITPIQLLYDNTIIYETSMIGLDDGRILIPKPQMSYEDVFVDG